MASDLETYLKLCPPESDPTLLNTEVQSLNHDYEEMVIEVCECVDCGVEFMCGTKSSYFLYYELLVVQHTML